MSGIRSPISKRVARGASWGALTCAGLSLLAVAVEDRIEAHERAALWHGETFITVEGHRVRHRLWSAGAPGPTVVFLNGFYASSEKWDTLIERLGGVAPTLCYDRAGQGLSEGPGSEHGASMVSELEGVLHAPGIRPPFILVSYSASGLLAEAFAKEHADELAGLVFLDTVMPEEQLATTSADQERRARGVHRGMLKAAFQVTLGISRVRRWMSPGPIDRGDEILLLRSHTMETFPEARANLELAAETVGLAMPQVPVAMLTTYEGDPEPAAQQTLALQRRLAASSGHEIFRAARGVDHATLLETPRGVDAARDILLEEIAATRGAPRAAGEAPHSVAP